MDQYNPLKIEDKWQKRWEENGLYQAVDFDRKPKKYLLIEFPYPSGERLHVGHGRSYCCLDALARKWRMEGKNVLYPIGWDAFGLPAENYAIKTGINPAITTSKNIKNAKKQAKSWGLSFDWSREIKTTAPHYYKWTQWIFLKMLEHGLAYQDEVSVNWCSTCKTNLADEEVFSDGTHERCGKLTGKRKQKQWLLRITKYADRLLEDLKTVDYLPKIVQQQINWIGKSTGMEIEFKIKGESFRSSEICQAPRDSHNSIKIFTTAHDTIFGVTFLVLSPEHPLVTKILEGKIKPQDTSDGGRLSWRSHDSPEVEELKKYVETAKNRSELERKSETKGKGGVDTGLRAINPFTQKEMPIYVADYVLMGYGTGAIMAVPGHDRRDYEFAKKYGLPIVSVVQPRHPCKVTPCEAKSGFWDDEMINSDFLNGLTSHQAKIKIEEEIEKQGIGKKAVHYHLRDWVFSRQHYWGEPIPVVYCAACAKTNKKNELSVFGSRSSDFGLSVISQSVSKTGKPKTGKLETENRQLKTDNGIDYAIVPVPEDQLPVELPYVEKYEPTGTWESPLAGVKDWVETKCPRCGGKARRETDTMPNWAGSNWYYVGYLVVRQLGNEKWEAGNWNKKMRSGKRENIKKSHVSLQNPASQFSRFTSSGQKDIFSQNKDLLKYWLPVDLYNGGMEHTTLHLLYSRFVYKFLFDLKVVPTSEPYQRRHSHGTVLGADGAKMSKSAGNVINPDEIIKTVGADTFRLYEMFMGPFEQTVSWSGEGMMGCHRFLKRVWLLSQSKLKDFKTPQNLEISLQKTIKKVGEDLEGMKFNTAVAAMMEFINLWARPGMFMNKKEVVVFLQILAPFAPHITEELWEKLKGRESLRSVRQFSAVQNLTQDSLRSFRSSKIGDLPATRKPSWSIHSSSWPKYNAKAIAEKEAVIIVEVNGKMRDKLEIRNWKPEARAEIEKMARGSEKVNKYLADRKVKKVIFVPGKLINFVVE